MFRPMLVIAFMALPVGLPHTSHAQAVKDLYSQLSKQSGLDVRTLQKDWLAVNAALRVVEEDFAKNPQFTRTDADHVTAWTWRDLRDKQKPSEPITEKTLLIWISHRGKLVVESTPNGADIEVDDTHWGTTKKEGWPVEGTYTVKLALDGYKPVSGPATVESGKVTVFERDLEKIDE